MQSDTSLQSLTLAKLTPPVVESSIHRDRLFQKIEEAQQHSGLWISGPGGSGKTVLVASYLTARQRPAVWMRLDAGDSDPATFFYYLRLAAEKKLVDNAQLPALFAAENIPALAQFTRTFFRDLYQALPQDCVLVFDNAQDQMLNEQANQLLVTAITEAPVNIKIIIISRSNPPNILSNARMKGELTQIDWPDLSFSNDELEQLAKNQVATILGAEPDKSTLQQAIEYSKGWAAGFLLLLQKKELKGYSPTSIEPSQEQELFDYFASEIFAELKDEYREFLLETAFLPVLTSTLAERLTQNQDSHLILDKMVRSNHFTNTLPNIEENSFEYHPLFKRFLLAQAQLEFTQKKINQIQQKAAHLLIDAGQLEAAAPLLLETKEWQPLVHVILSLAPQLLAQGRHQRLNEWLDTIPVKLLNDLPWLVYWQGIAQMPLNLNKSYQLLSTAFEQFFQDNELTGAAQAWAGAVESLFHSLSNLARMDEWLPKLERLLERFSIDNEVELKALLAPQVVAIYGLRAPIDKSNLETWLDITQGLLTQDTDPTQRSMAGSLLISHFIWAGQPARVEHIFNIQQQILREETVRPLARVNAKLTAAWFAWIRGHRQDCKQAIKDGLALSKESGVNHWIFVLLIQGTINSLMHADTEEAQTYFAQLELMLKDARDLDRAYYHHEMGWLEMLNGHPEKALLQQQQALGHAERLGTPYTMAEIIFGQSQALHAIGDLPQASLLLSQAQKLAEQWGSNTLRFQCGLLNSWYQYQSGDIKAAADTLQSTFEHAKKEGYNAFSWWLPEQIAELCAFALTRGIEPVFVKNFIKRFDLPPPYNSGVSSEWPWPIRIETLGTFNLTINNEPMQFTSKAQHRPIDLLKVLVAMGGTGVSNEYLAEALWPDAEGDAAARSLQTTLHRVRKLLQHDDAIEVKQGLISLNPKIVWVDIYALENMLQDITKVHINTLQILAQDILKLYQGPFLEHEAEESWSISLRERLRGHLLKGLQQLAERLRAIDERILARNLYEAAINIDPFSEDSYRHLMACHAIANNKTEALAVYSRLCEILEKQFNTTPSSATSQLAEFILADDHHAVRESFPIKNES